MCYFTIEGGSRMRNKAPKIRMRVQVYGSHEQDTFLCIEYLRKENPGYISDSHRGPGWPSPTEVNRLAVEYFLKHLKKAN